VIESTTADQLFDAIGRDVNDKNVDLAKDIAADVQARLSVPVQRVPITEVERIARTARGAEQIRASDSLSKMHRNDPIHGNHYKLLRSIKGEPARLETGQLRESIQYATLDLGGDTEAIVFSDSPYGGQLEEHPYDRLVLTDLLPSYIENILDAAKDGIEGT
jgi:hypothetical protein